MKFNYIHSCKNRFVICIQDTSDVNLSLHSQRIQRDEFIGTTNAKNTQCLVFSIHPSLVLDAETGVPYGFSTIKVWNRPLDFKNKYEREYNKLPIEDKESYKWIEVSKEIVQRMLIVQDREGDIYEQFAVIPNENNFLFG